MQPYGVYLNTNAPNINAAPADDYYTPYLGLRARLSQTWINKWTVLLLLIIVRLLISLASIKDDIASAKTEALSACTSVESVGSTMASMPHYLSQGVNKMAADGITKAVNGLMQMLYLSLTGVEEIVLFVIHMMTSTYMCLITLAISGSLEVAIEMIEEVGAFMNKSIATITGDMSSGLKTFEDDLNSFLSKINIGGIFGKSTSPPTIDLSSEINKLNGIQIDPTQMDADLAKLNASLPTFDQVQNFTDSIIKLPFEEVKKLVNESMVAYKFDDSVFPVPQKKSLTFCSGNTAFQDFFVGLVKVVDDAKIILLVILLLAAILACIPMAYREIWGWRSMQRRAALIKSRHYTNEMDILYQAHRPYTSQFGLRIARQFTRPKNQILARWFVAYATSIPALFVLALGVAGLFTCLCHYLLLRALEKEVPALAAEVGGFADHVVQALNNASESWALAANSVINSTNTQINDDLFGWVNTTTGAIDKTLDVFTTEMTTALNATFGGTILYTPIMGVFECLVGLKVAGIETGLAWVGAHAHVAFPEFDPDVFSLGAAAALTNSSADDDFLAAPASSTTDEVTRAVMKVGGKLEGVIRQEALISAALVAVYLVVVLVGLGRVLSPPNEDFSPYNGIPAPKYEESSSSPSFSSPFSYLAQMGKGNGNGNGTGNGNRGPWVRDEKERELWEADGFGFGVEGEGGGFGNGNGGGAPPRRV
ncbi:plasma membrane fusion protein prm1 [Ciborinia camelliae]|nr:plasma membrane fusion protein prm1 [Ciborinia camelliae]